MINTSTKAQTERPRAIVKIKDRSVVALFNAYNQLGRPDSAYLVRPFVIDSCYFWKVSRDGWIRATFKTAQQDKKCLDDLNSAVQSRARWRKWAIFEGLTLVGIASVLIITGR